MNKNRSPLRQMDTASTFRPLQSVRQNGFTLIELLVVIAIVAILASILFPVFARARENGRTSRCLSNTKQLSLAVIMYTQDSDQKLPYSYDGRPWPYTIWSDCILSYVKNTDIFFCPDDLNASPKKAVNSLNISYGWNFVYLDTLACTPAGYGCGGVLLSKINRPAQTVLLGDAALHNSNDGAYAIACQYDNPTGTNYGLSPMHKTGANVAFVDGHSKWYPLPGVITSDVTLWNMS